MKRNHFGAPLPTVIKRSHEQHIWSGTWPYTAMSARLHAHNAISAFGARIIWKSTKANIWQLNRTSAINANARSAALNYCVATFLIGTQTMQPLSNASAVNLYAKRWKNWSDIVNPMSHKRLHAKHATNRLKRKQNWPNIRNRISMSRKHFCAQNAEWGLFETITSWCTCEGTLAKNVRRRRDKYIYT